MEALASTPAKVILTGEHFVVYDKPAIVMAIDLRAKVRVKDNFKDSISIFSNLGYSGIYRKDRYYPEKGGVNGKKFLDPIKIAATSVLRFDYCHEPLKFCAMNHQKFEPLYPAGLHDLSREH